MNSPDPLYLDLDPQFRTRLEAAARRERSRAIASFIAGLFKSRPVERRTARPVHAARPC